MWIVASLLLLTGFVFLFASGSEPMKALVITLWLSPLVLLASYFLARRSAGPTPTESRLAKGWIVFRRVVCYSTSAITGLIGVGMTVMGVKASSLSLVGSGVFFAAIAFVAARVGMYGSETEYTFTGDKAAHEKRKKRYGWK
jgi:hypothetical protein